MKLPYKLKPEFNARLEAHAERIEAALRKREEAYKIVSDKAAELSGIEAKIPLAIAAGNENPTADAAREIATLREHVSLMKASIELAERRIQTPVNELRDAIRSAVVEVKNG